MFDVGKSLPIDGVPGGTTLLCVGPPMAGKRRLALRALGAGTRPRDATVLVSTDSSTEAVRTEYEAAVEGDRTRVGVVDCAGDAYGEVPEDDLTRHVPTPADLGAVGAATTDLLDSLASDHADARSRVGLLSLTTLALSATVDRTVAFIHSLADEVRRRDGLAVLTAHTSTFERADVTRLASLVDGTVFVREGADGVEVRVEGLPDAPTEWTPVPVPAVARADVGVPGPQTPATAVEPSGPAREVPFDSLSDLVDRVDGQRPTLTVANRETGDEAFAPVESFFEGLDVEVRETSLGTPRPRDLAMLHHGSDMIAASSLPEVVSGVVAATAEDDPFRQRRGPDVLEALDERVFGASGVEKQFLVDASTAIEMTAWGTGGGLLVAGFQELSRYWESPRSRRVIDHIARAGVDVHVYGEPDVVPDPDEPNVTVHPVTDPEIASTWFVAFDGAGQTDRTGALVVRESDPEEYHGFWTYDPSLSADVIRYVSETYGDVEEGSEQAAP